MAITKISFLARYHTREIHYDTVGTPFGHVSYAKTQTVQHDKEAVFVLGPGPCGKTVDKLDVRYQAHDIVIIQYHDDGTLKEFPYQRKDVLGRLTIERSVLQ